MKATMITPEQSPAAGLGVPEDLSAGWERNAFLRLVYEAVHEVDWPEASATIPSPTMLATLLTWALSTGTYSSPEIEWAARMEPTGRYICANRPPGWAVIRRFRRENMASVQKTLARLFALAQGGKEERDFMREAQLRLKRAVQADSMALDY